MLHGQFAPPGAITLTDGLWPTHAMDNKETRLLPVFNNSSIEIMPPAQLHLLELYRLFVSGVVFSLALGTAV